MILLWLEKRGEEENETCMTQAQDTRAFSPSVQFQDHDDRTDTRYRDEEGPYDPADLRPEVRPVAQREYVDECNEPDNEPNDSIDVPLYKLRVRERIFRGAGDVPFRIRKKEKLTIYHQENAPCCAIQLS